MTGLSIYFEINLKTALWPFVAKVAMLNIFTVICTLLPKIFSVNLQHSSCKLLHVISIRVETVCILIRWLSQKPADLDLQCFQKGTVSGSSTGPLDYGATGPVLDTEPRL